MLSASRADEAPPEFRLEWRGPWVSVSFPRRHLMQAADVREWPDPDKVQACLQVIAANGLLIVCGRRGTGKTQLACWMGSAYPRENALYVTARDLFASMKSWLSLPATDQAHNTRMLRTCPLLVIDEVHDRLDTEFEGIELNSLIDARYGRRLPTVLISNLEAKVLAKNLGASIISRAQEGGGVVEIDWPSFRAQAPHREQRGTTRFDGLVSELKAAKAESGT